ncbi:MAG TPA: formylglycine-generating enzyme family protein [Candidatus Acidoferrales bacterium]|nr:formylglycine-generating enzyme family protein [Candidatus Acidoferrales bacterium]
MQVKRNILTVILCIALITISSCTRNSSSPIGAVPENSIGMVYVTGGTFQMGSNSGYSDQRPVHSVTLSNFYIGKYIVTQKEWRDVVQWKQGSSTSPLMPDPSYFKGDNLPVEQVDWNEVQTWISYLNEKEGTTNYRLPTEAEWEYAARGGNRTKGYVFSGSDNADDVAWHDSNAGGRTHAVGTKLPNELGIYDMSGDVWEWCSDFYGGPYSNKSQYDPTGATNGESRILRGGSWSNINSVCVCTFRYPDYPINRYAVYGFRIAKDK